MTQPLAKVVDQPRTRILFVDDDEAILRVLARMLAPEAYRWDMTFIHGGPAGMKAVTDGAFDILVTDLEMPMIDGRALIAAAHRCSGHVCVLHTGSGIDPRLVHGRVLAKPAARGELQRILEACATEVEDRNRSCS